MLYNLVPLLVWGKKMRLEKYCTDYMDKDVSYD